MSSREIRNAENVFISANVVCCRLRLLQNCSSSGTQPEAATGSESVCIVCCFRTANAVHKEGSATPVLSEPVQGCD